MLKMKLFWSLLPCLIQINLTLSFVLLKDYIPQKPGILEIFTKPKIPKIPVIGGIQIGTHVGGGSFGFGFGFGGQFIPPGSGVNLPPKENTRPEKPETGWENEDKENPHPEKPVTSLENEDKKIMNPRPNWDEDIDKKPEPQNHEDDNSKSLPYEEDDTRPDWEDIGEIDEDNKTEDLMDGELVADGLIQPRLKSRRAKRLVDSKVYHVPLKFFSNARPYKVESILTS